MATCKSHLQTLVTLAVLTAEVQFVTGSSHVVQLAVATNRLHLCSLQAESCRVCDVMRYPCFGVAYCSFQTSSAPYRMPMQKRHSLFFFLLQYSGKPRRSWSVTQVGSCRMKWVQAHLQAGCVCHDISSKWQKKAPASQRFRHLCTHHVHLHHT